MMKLPQVYADNALFLHSAPLDIRGVADGGAVTVVLTQQQNVVGTWTGVCAEDGSFFALGSVVEREEGSAIKSVKIFEL